MRVEIKQNQILIEFSETETNLIAQKAGKEKIEDVGNYIKEEIAQLFALQDLAGNVVSGFGHDFDLDTIKTVSNELKKRKGKAGESAQRLESIVPVAQKRESFALTQQEKFVKDNSLESEASGKSQTGQDLPGLEENLSAPVPDQVIAVQAASHAREDAIEEVGDELLADLLDKDLLKGNKKPETGAS